MSDLTPTIMNFKEGYDLGFTISYKILMSIINVENVGLVLSKNQILKNINVSFEQGLIHGLIGRNGSGKTMLMKCICGFIKPTEGKITVDGKVVGDDVDFPKDTGIIIETAGFIPYYSGYKNLKLINCTTKGCDLAFEYSEVEVDIKGHVDSIKNPKSGTITVDSVGERINEDSIMVVNMILLNK